VQPHTSLADSAMLQWDVREERRWRRVEMRVMVEAKSLIAQGRERDLVANSNT
jgi:hypothetical protein